MPIAEHANRITDQRAFEFMASFPNIVLTQFEPSQNPVIRLPNPGYDRRAHLEPDEYKLTVRLIDSRQYLLVSDCQAHFPGPALRG